MPVGVYERRKTGEATNQCIRELSAFDVESIGESESDYWWQAVRGKWLWQRCTPGGVDHIADLMNIA
jgi:hypothetical protein